MLSNEERAQTQQNSMPEQIGAGCVIKALGEGALCLNILFLIYKKEVEKDVHNTTCPLRTEDHVVIEQKPGWIVFNHFL